MFSVADYVSTGEAIHEWLEQDENWQRLADQSHDGNLPEKIRTQARREWYQRSEELVAKILDTLRFKPRTLRLYLLPNFRPEQIKGGKKIRESLEYLITNPHARSMTSMRIAELIANESGNSPQSWEAARKNVDRAKLKFVELGYLNLSPMNLPRRYLDLPEITDALRSGDASKLPLENTEIQLSNKRLYLKRKRWTRWAAATCPFCP